MASFFKSFLFPKVRAQDDDDEEELVCQQDELKGICGQKPHLLALWSKFESCTERVNSREQTAETCVEELHDYVHEMDLCVKKILLSKLK